MATFMVKFGKHTAGRQKDGTRVILKPGDTFETQTDKQTEFCRKYNDKFEEVRTHAYPDPTPMPPVSNTTKEVSHTPQVEITEEDLDKMTVPQLLAFIRQHDLKSEGVKTKENLLKQIKEQLS